MSQRQCQVSGCPSLASGYSNFCGRHRRTKTRHGHPKQAAITAMRMDYYCKQIEARQKGNRKNAAWAILGARWAALVDRARTTIAMRDSGRPFVKHDYQAAQQLVNLAEHSEGQIVVRVVLAMFLMRDAEPLSFWSDKGFEYQLVRRVRSLAPMNAGSFWSHKDQRIRRVYKDLPPRVVEALAWDLVESFGGAGLQLAALIRRQPPVDPAVEERQRLVEAIEELA